MDFWFNILSSRFQAYQERGAAYASLGRFDEVDNVTSLSSTRCLFGNLDYPRSKYMAQSP